MVRKKLAVVVAALGAMQANVAGALGLGEFSLDSSLNQPLSAEIRLLNVEDLNDSQIIIKLGSGGDFDRAGLPRDYFLTGLKFKVVLDERGGGVIRVTTKEPVIEPYLDFLVEARWPSGRLLREYTVLMDLPTFSETESAPVVAATAAGQMAEASAAADQQEAAVSQASYGPAAGSSSVRKTLQEGNTVAGTDYRVRQDDTLWEIAAKAKPNSQLSVQQTMLGIQRLNPNAFINGNINRLKAGYVLRLPTEDQIADIGQQAAVANVAEQNRSWRTGESTASSTTTAPQLDATSTSDDSGGEYRSDSRLSIATAGDSQQAGAGEGEGASGSGSVALRSELALSKENLDKTERENEELESRLDDMESKMATLQRLIELKDDQLAAMQGEAAQADIGSAEQAEITEDAVVVEDTVVVEGTVVVEDTVVVDEAGDVLAEQVVVEEDVLEKPSVVAPKVAAPAAEPGLLDRLLANPLYAGAGLLVLVILAALMLMRRRKAEEPAFELDDDFSVDTPDSDDVVIEAAPDVDETPAIEEEQLDLEEDFELKEDEEAAAPVQSETGDAIAEADIYIAYGRFQQAVDLLKTAVAQESGRSDLKIKLLEVYLEMRDKPSFQALYTELQALGDDAAIADVKETLSTVDGVSDWLDGMSAAGSFTDADMDADLIDGDELDVELDTEEEIDLDLDDELNMSLTMETPAINDTDLDLDLELELGDDLDSTELDDLSLDGDESLVELDELSLDIDSAADVSVSEDSASEDSASEDSALDDLSGEDFDLNLDDDLDMDLGELAGDTDLGDLESEFGDSDPTVAGAALDDPSLDAELDTGLDLGDSSLDDDLGELDTDLGDLGAELDDAADVAPVEEAPAAAAPEPAAESFEQAVESADADADDDFDFLTDTDEVATKLDLARAYIDMGDTEGAKDILDEVVQEGDDGQKQEASTLLERI